MPLFTSRWRRHEGSRPSRDALTWLSVVLLLPCLVLFFAASTASAASVYPSVAISNLDTQVYARDAPVGRVVTFWFNATDCTDVEHALVSGSVYVSAPASNASAVTNNITLQFPSWAVNAPYDHLVVCARDATARGASLALSADDDDDETAAVLTVPDVLSSLAHTKEDEEEATTGPDAPLNVTLIWPPVPLRDLLQTDVRTRATADAVVFDLLGETDFYDLYHAPMLHRLSYTTSSAVAEAIFYVGLRQRISASEGSTNTATTIMMPSFCTSPSCEANETAATAGRELTSEEAEYVLSVLSQSTLYVYPSPVSEDDAAADDSGAEACGPLYRQQLPSSSTEGDISFTANGVRVPTANLTVQSIASASPSLTSPRWLITGRFTNLTSDQYTAGLYPLCVAPAFLYLTEAATPPPALSWSSAQGQAMAGITSLTPDLYTLRATSVLASESALLWDLSAVLTIEAASSTGWPAASITPRYAIVVGANASTACEQGTRLFAGALLDVAGSPALQRRTPSLRFGPASLTTSGESSDVVATAEDWAAIFPETATLASVTLSVCLGLDDEDTGSAGTAATTWAGTVQLQQLRAYSTTVLLATPANTSMLTLATVTTATTTTTTRSTSLSASTPASRADDNNDGDSNFAMCVVPTPADFTATADASFFLSTASGCSGTRYAVPALQLGDASSTAPTLGYARPEAGVSYWLCLAVNATKDALTEEVTATSAAQSIHFLPAPNVTSQPIEVYYDTPFALSIAVDAAVADAAVFAIPSTENCESLTCPPDASYTPTVLSEVSTVINGIVTVEVPLSASSALESVNGTVRLCLATTAADANKSTRNFSLTTLPILLADDATTTTTTTTTATPTVPPVPGPGVYPTTIVKGQVSVLHSASLTTGNANLAYDAGCNQLLFSPFLSIQSGRVTLTVARCANLDVAYYCERQGPSYPYISVAKLDVVSLYNCSSETLINIVPVTVAPATPVTVFGVALNSSLTNTTPFLSQVSDCTVPPSDLARAVQANGFMTALGESLKFYVCVTSLDGTLNFTNTNYGPTLTIAPFSLSPQFAMLGVTVPSAALSPAVPIPNSTFIIRGLTGNGWDGTLVSNTAPSTIIAQVVNWTSALCNTSVPDQTGAPRAWWRAASLGRGESHEWLSEWGTDESDTAAYYANLGPYYVCSNRTNVTALVENDDDTSSGGSGDSSSSSSSDGEGVSVNATRVPITTFVSVAPPLVDWLTIATVDAYVCVRMLVPGGQYSLLPANNLPAAPSGLAWEKGVYLMPTTAADYAAAVAAHANLCADGPYTSVSSSGSGARDAASGTDDDNSGGDVLRDGYSGVAYMATDLPDVVCAPTTNLTSSDTTLYLLCSGTPAGYQQTNQTIALAERQVSPTDLTAGATVTMTLLDAPSTQLIFTPAALGCSAIPDGMPSFATNASGVGTATLVVTSSSLGIPLRPLDAGAYTLCQQLTWQSPAPLVVAADATSRTEGRAAQRWVTKSGWAPLTTMQVHEAIFYGLSSHVFAVNVTSSLFLLDALTADVLKPGFYTDFDCSDDSLLDASIMSWSLVDSNASSAPQLEVVATQVPTDASGAPIAVHLCAFTALNATYQPVPNNEAGIQVLVDPFFFRETVHECEQLDVFFNDRQLIGSGGDGISVQLVVGPCCNPDVAATVAATVQVGTALARFYRSFLLNDTTMALIAPTTALTVCVYFHARLPSGGLESAPSCGTAGTVTVRTDDSYCDVNPGVLPYLVLPARANVYSTGVAPTFLATTWSALIAIAVVAGVVLLFVIIAMIVGCAVKRPPRQLKGEPDLAEALAHTPPMWVHVATARTEAEAEAAAARKRAQPAREAELEQRITHCLQSQLLPAMSHKEVAECLRMSLRGTPHALHADTATRAEHDAFYDPVALYLGDSARARAPASAVSASASLTVAVDTTSSAVQPGSSLAATDSAKAPAAPTAPTPLVVPTSTAAQTAAPRPVVSAPSPSLSPAATPAKATAAPQPVRPLQGSAAAAAAAALRDDLLAEEAAARAQLEEDEDDALYQVLEKERCRWRDLMAGEGVRLKTLLEQDPFWSSRLAMLESLNTRALERAADRSLTRDRSIDHDATDAPGVWGAGRAMPPPPPLGDDDDDDDVFSAASGVMTPLSETVLVYPVAPAGPGAALRALTPVQAPPTTTQAEADGLDEAAGLDADGLATMYSHITDEAHDDDDATDADEALDLDESLFSSASGGGSQRGPRRLVLLQTPETSASRAGPPAAQRIAVVPPPPPSPPPKPTSHRDPQAHLLPPAPSTGLVTEDGDLYSDVSGAGESAGHAPRWTPPPPAPLQLASTAHMSRSALQRDRHAHDDDEASAFSDASAHASVPGHGARAAAQPAAARRAQAAPPGRSLYAGAEDVDAVEARPVSPVEAMANPLPTPAPHLWAGADSRDAAVHTPPLDEDGTATSGTGLLYSPSSGNRRMTMPRAAISPSARPLTGGVSAAAPAARALSWSPPSAMASVPREGPAQPAAAAVAPTNNVSARDRKKSSHYEDALLDEL